MCVSHLVQIVAVELEHPQVDLLWEAVGDSLGQLVEELHLRGEVHKLLGFL